MAENVYLWDVQGYDPERIRDVFASTIMDEGIEFNGRILVKPNCVAAHPIYFTHAFTRSEVIEGVVSKLKEVKDIEEIMIGERSGITIPTRLGYRYAGYGQIKKRYGARLVYFEEERQVEVALKRDECIRKRIFVPEPVVTADFFINIPKFKTHPWTMVTFSLKNFIGLQDDAHRLLDHDYRLEEKIADLQEVVRPHINIIDAIISGSGRMLTPRPVHTNMMIIGRNSVAVDAVCCNLLGIDPLSVKHIRLCYERGFGSVRIEDINLRGDIPFDRAKERFKDVWVGRIKVDDFFKDSPLKAVGGLPPDPGKSDYCWGGCPGALEEAIDVISQVQSGAIRKVKEMSVLYGDTGLKELKAGKGRGGKVIFMGDCARFKGRINGEEVAISSIYKDASLKDNRSATAEDIFYKMAKTYLKMGLSRRRSWLRITGCPVSVAEHVLILSSLGGLKNPYFDRRVVIPFLIAWLKSKIVKAVKTLLGKLKKRYLKE